MPEESLIRRIWLEGLHHTVVFHYALLAKPVVVLEAPPLVFLCQKVDGEAFLQTKSNPLSKVVEDGRLIHLLAQAIRGRNLAREAPFNILQCQERPETDRDMSRLTV